MTSPEKAMIDFKKRDSVGMQDFHQYNTFLLKFLGTISFSYFDTDTTEVVKFVHRCRHIAHLAVNTPQTTKVVRR